MWHAVGNVDKRHDPIVYEGDRPKTVTVHNAGPSTVYVKGWLTVSLSDGTLVRIRPLRGWTVGDTDGKLGPPDFKLELRPGNQRTISAALIRASIKQTAEDLGQTESEQTPEYAAIGWHIHS
mgnify:CR=1 FL=1